MPDAIRRVATAAAVDMAIALRDTHTKYQGGAFGKAYKEEEAELQALATKDWKNHDATESEIAALQAAQTALYKDTAGGLQQAAQRSGVPSFLKAHESNRPALEALIRGSQDVELGSHQRQALCDVLSAYKAGMKK